MLGFTFSLVLKRGIPAPAVYLTSCCEPRYFPQAHKAAKFFVKSDLTFYFIFSSVFACIFLNFTLFVKLMNVYHYSIPLSALQLLIYYQTCLEYSKWSALLEVYSDSAVVGFGVITLSCSGIFLEDTHRMLLSLICSPCLLPTVPQLGHQ